VVLIPIQDTSEMTVSRVAVARSRAVRHVEEVTGNPFLWVARLSIQGRGAIYWF
jgi:hypothetical protein